MLGRTKRPKTGLAAFLRGLKPGEVVEVPMEMLSKSGKARPVSVVHSVAWAAGLKGLFTVRTIDGHTFIARKKASDVRK